MKNKKSIEFKGSVATLSTLTVSLRSNQLDQLKKDLRELCGDSPDFFNEDLAVLDAAGLPGEGADFDWPALVALLRAVRLNPVAVRHAAAGAEAKIRAAGLNLAEEIEVASRKAATGEPEAKKAPATPTTPAAANPAPQPTRGAPTALPAQPELDLAAKSTPPINASTSSPAAPSNAPATTSTTTPSPTVSPGRPPAERTAPPLPATFSAPTVVVDKPLRSGQQVYARNADLVVLAMVNPGAEVMADGNIHVYAPLRGRAMAGASGNRNARILTTCFEAELVSIGGVYRPLEPGMPKDVSGKPAQVRFSDAGGKETLLIDPLRIV